MQQLPWRPCKTNEPGDARFVKCITSAEVKKSRSSTWRNPATRNPSFWVTKLIWLASQAVPHVRDRESKETSTIFSVSLLVSSINPTPLWSLSYRLFSDALASWLMFLPAVERAAAGFGSLRWGIRENKCLDRLGLQLVPTCANTVVNLPATSLALHWGLCSRSFRRTHLNQLPICLWFPPALALS